MSSIPAVLALLVALLSAPSCVGLGPSWTTGVSGSKPGSEGAAPERVSVGGLIMLSNDGEDRFVREAFMKELRLLGLVQDEGNPDLVFLGDVTMSAPHEPFGGHDVYLTLAAYLPGTPTQVWWCRVYREYDVYKRSRDEMRHVLKKAAQLFEQRLSNWGGK